MWIPLRDIEPYPEWICRISGFGFSKTARHVGGQGAMLSVLLKMDHGHNYKRGFSPMLLLYIYSQSLIIIIIALFLSLYLSLFTLPFPLLRRKQLRLRCSLRSLYRCSSPFFPPVSRLPLRPYPGTRTRIDVMTIMRSGLWSGIAVKPRLPFARAISQPQSPPSQEMLPPHLGQPGSRALATV